MITGPEMFRLSMVVLLLASAAAGQTYDGPHPPKPDLPYLKHASNLVPTEVTEAKEEKRKNDTLYVIAGAQSTARTPLAMPIFLIKAAKLAPDHLQLYRLELKDGHREILFGAKKPALIHMEVTKLSADGIYKLEVNDELEPGEYSLTPDNSNQVFCFQVF
jgi:hypothetical protein